MEYEFTTVMDLAMDHNAIASKDRTGLFDGQIFKPSVDTGAMLMAWLDKGATPDMKITKSQVMDAIAYMGEKRVDQKELLHHLGVGKLADWVDQGNHTAKELFLAIDQCADRKVQSGSYA
jgi:hypothetical protein